MCRYWIPIGSSWQQLVFPVDGPASPWIRLERAVDGSSGANRSMLAQAAQTIFKGHRIVFILCMKDRNCRIVNIGIPRHSENWFPLPTTLKLPSSTFRCPVPSESDIRVPSSNFRTLRVEKLLWMSGAEVVIPRKPLVSIHAELVGLEEYSLEQYTYFISMATNRPHLVLKLVPNPEESIVTVVIDHEDYCASEHLRHQGEGECDLCDSPILFGGHTLGREDYGTYEYGEIHNDIEMR
jgi:hypothetical protein